MAEAATLPGCIGSYGAPVPPNGPCSECSAAQLCKEATKYDDEKTC